MNAEQTSPTDHRPLEHREKAPKQTPTAWGELVGLTLAVAALLAVVITAFAWPNVTGAPNGVQLGVAAPPQVAEQLEGHLTPVAGEGAFELTALTDRAAAEQAIRDRQIYGAIVLGPDGGQMLTAGAASPAVAQVLAQVAASVPDEAGGPLEVVDIVPLPADDPRGVGLGSAVLPLVIGGIASGALSSTRVRGTGRRLACVLSIAVVGAVALLLVLQTWLGAVAGSFWANAGVLALGMAAIGTSIVGLHRHLGTAGIGLVAATMVLVGNPFSGVMTAPEMLPGFWGTIGQWLPPGATGTALRSVGWFEGAGATGAFVVLACWLVAGTTLALVPTRNRR